MSFSDPLVVGALSLPRVIPKTTGTTRYQWKYGGLTHEVVLSHSRSKTRKRHTIRLDTNEQSTTAGVVSGAMSTILTVDHPIEGGALTDAIVHDAALFALTSLFTDANLVKLLNEEV